MAGGKKPQSFFCPTFFCLLNDFVKQLAAFSCGGGQFLHSHCIGTQPTGVACDWLEWVYKLTIDSAPKGAESVGSFPSKRARKLDSTPKINFVGKKARLQMLLFHFHVEIADLL